MTEYRQKPTAEGLKAEQEARENEQVINDYKNIMKAFINPARQAEGLNIKQV